MHRLHVYGLAADGNFAAGRSANISVVSRRRRHRPRTVTSSGQPAAPSNPPPRRDHMARVHVDDATWQVFKTAAGETPISELLGQLAGRCVQHHRAREAEARKIGDRELLEARQRATDLQRDLSRLVERLEHRIDRRDFNSLAAAEGLTSRTGSL